MIRSKASTTIRIRVARYLGVFALAISSATVAQLAGIQPASAQTTYTWSGGGGSSNTNWSDGSNWSGGQAPSTAGTVDLVFPTPTCTASGCSNSNNDISGLIVDNLTIDNSYSTSPVTGYSITGNSITVDTLDATTSGAAPGSLANNQIGLSITLGGTSQNSQIWTFTGPGSPVFLAAVSGTASLTMSLSSQADPIFDAGVNVGPLSITGASSSNTGAQAFKNGNVVLSGLASLNSSPVNSVTVTDAQITSAASASISSGPLTTSGAELLQQGVPPGTLAGFSLSSAPTLDSNSLLSYSYLSPGSNNQPLANTTYPQLSASSSINLGSMQLSLTADCNQTLGTVYTLVSVTGSGNSLTGTFYAPSQLGGAPTQIANGATMQANPTPSTFDSSCSSAVPTDFQINYTSTSVTATVVTLPTITSVTPNSGLTSGGTSVTIDGANFSGATAVDFGSTAATTFNVVSGSQITASSPAENAGTVNVTVTTSAGTSATSSLDDFTFGSGGGSSSLWPDCSGSVTTDCIASLSYNGSSQLPANLGLNVLSAAGIGVEIQFQCSNNFSYELSSCGASNSDIFSISLNLGTMSPTDFLATGTIASETVTNSNGAYNLKFTGSPGAASWVDSQCTLSSCPNQASVDYSSFFIAFAGTMPTPPNLTNSEQASFKAFNTASEGTWIATNAQAFSFPTLNPTTGALQFQLAAPHLMNSGQPNQGRFTAFLPNALLQYWGVTATQLQNELNVAEVDNSVTTSVVPTIAVTSTGAEITLSNFHYSGPTFDIIATPASSSSSNSSPATSPPPAPPGATSSDGGSSSSQNGVADVTDGSTSASASGIGGVTVSLFNSDPVGVPVFAATNDYFDVKVSSGNTFSNLTTTNCNLNGGNSVTWWNPNANNGTGAWEPVSNQTFSAGPPACVTVTVTDASSPSLSQLTGTIFAVADGPTVTSLVPSNGGGAGGTSVTITGTNFTGATAVNFGTVPATNFTVVSSTEIIAVSPPGTGLVNVTVTTPSGVSSSGQASLFDYSPGYRLVGSDGGVFSFGDASFYGSMGGQTLAKPIVGMAATPDGKGYWLVGSDGGVFSFGDASFYGSMGGQTLAKPIVGMAATPDGKGYWLVGSDGGVFSFGDASFYGSMGGQTLAKPIVGMAATPDGKGYWLVGSDGGVFSFGDASFYGSMGGQTLAKPIVGMAATPDGKGYWLVGSDGGVFSFGDASFYGSMGGQTLAKPIVGMAATPDGKGYWLVGSDGGVFSFGDASFYGSMAGLALNRPIVAES